MYMFTIRIEPCDPDIAPRDPSGIACKLYVLCVNSRAQLLSTS